MKAIWNDQIIAESDDTIIIENNHYFPKESVNETFIKSTDSHTVCPWKGQAHYYDLVVNGNINNDAAWYYPAPSLAAQHIKDYVAFWKGVTITE
tara:strand:+ start:321 stop:602 length:282 start_codon:yes stop_codon:yes gene_type:complete